MKKEWKVLVCGVRGSVPMPEREFLAYGGNTSCIALHYGSGLLVFDAGTGLVRLERKLREENIKRVDIVISHLHIDHLSGLFGFSMFQDPEAEIRFYGQAGQKIREYLDLLLGKPFWPVGLKEAAARIEVCEVRPGESFCLTEGNGGADEIRVDTLQGNHPGGSLYYRVRTGKGEAQKCVVYALDCELEGDMPDRLAEFVEGSDLLIWDAAFAEEDLRLYRGWGHSSWRQGSALRKKADAKAALMTHYSKEYTDSFLQEQERLAKEADGAVCFAREGMVLEL